MSPLGLAHTNTAPDLSASRSWRASASTSGALSKSCSDTTAPRSAAPTVESNWTSGSRNDAIRARADARPWDRLGPECGCWFGDNLGVDRDLMHRLQIAA